LLHSTEDLTEAMLTVEETIQQLKISRRTLYNWINAKKIQSYKAAGRRTYFKPKEVQALFREKPHG
jgi:excisionase family DNA binding protein